MTYGSTDGRTNGKGEFCYKAVNWKTEEEME
jgi:hypothetical protein